VVLDGETGILVPYDAAEPRAFEHAFADAVNDLAADPTRARRMGEAGRLRAIANFDWDAISLRTIEVYRAALHR
jgi:starch synthase